MKWPWKDGGYNLKRHGAYAVTKHESQTRDGWFYIAWHQQTALGTHDSFADSEAACVAHSEKEEAK